MIESTSFGRGETVLAIHGITANAMSWSVVADALPDTRLLAVDLRGRGRSGGLPGPFGLRRHAEDLAELLDAGRTGPVVVAGHSMGAFVAVALAAHRPELVRALVLVDGGLPLAGPVDGIEAALGPAAARLGMEFPDEAAYLALWQQHPALARDYGPAVEAYARHDLTGAAPRLRSSASASAMLQDGAELYGEPWYIDALRGLRTRVEVLRAPRGLLDADPIYPPGTLEGFRSLVPQLIVTEVDDVNHYTILFAPRGARRVAEAITRAKEPTP